MARLAIKCTFVSIVLFGGDARENLEKTQKLGFFSPLSSGGGGDFPAALSQSAISLLRGKAKSDTIQSMQ
jgi:hypothetical protein